MKKQNVIELLKKIESGETTAEKELSNLKPELTIKDCFEKIRAGYFIDEMNQIQSVVNPTFNGRNVVSTKSRALQFQAITKMMAVADVLNGEKHWKPEEGDNSWCFFYDKRNKISFRHVEDMRSLVVVSFVYFKGEIISRARKILGDETIKTALGV